MATVEMTQDNFVSTVEGSGTVLVDFWASWCGPCRMFAPVFEEASEKHGDVTFAKVDTEANQQLAGALEIQAIPTLMAFRDGVLVYREAGAMNASGLEQLIEAVKGIDSEELKKQVAAAQAQDAEGAPTEN
ncbi:thioredoxin [Nigerium massiliense]|uniref:thioredoxin n=1 Tax=Nigerium massiliense TaxID=1522317 RepID=UPI0005907338|nr:thioredoxin [Nigerium massiliense]